MALASCQPNLSRWTSPLLPSNKSCSTKDLTSSGMYRRYLQMHQNVGGQTRVETKWCIWGQTRVDQGEDQVVYLRTDHSGRELFRVQTEIDTCEQIRVRELIRVGRELVEYAARMRVCMNRMLCTASQRGVNIRVRCPSLSNARKKAK